MNNEHPITPPPGLVQQWHDECHKVHEPFLVHIANQAARWGADQELDACCEWLQDPDLNVDTYKLRAARRPKPPTDKEQALHELGDAYDKDKIDDATYDTIKRALEALPND